jgi:hypothetical protein
MDLFNGNPIAGNILAFVFVLDTQPASFVDGLKNVSAYLIHNTVSFDLHHDLAAGI